jgi:hypothetical protein
MTGRDNFFRLGNDRAARRAFRYQTGFANETRKPFLTDNGNHILDCRCGKIENPAELNRELKLVTGVVETGLFIGMARVAVVARERAESDYLVKYPFANRLFPNSLDVLEHCKKHGKVVILTDGDVVFQPRKIERRGIAFLICVKQANICPLTWKSGASAICWLSTGQNFC